MSRFSEALEVYQEIYQFNEGIKDIEYNIGLCYYHQGKLEEAVDFMKRYLEKNPRDQMIYSYLCKILGEIKAYEEINEICEKAVIWRIKQIPRLLWAKSLYKTGKIKKAHAIALWAIEKKPKKSCGWLMLGKIFKRAGYLIEASHCYEKALYYDINSNEAKIKLGKLSNENMRSPFALRTDRKNILDEPLMPNSEDEKIRNCYDEICVVN